MRNKLLASYLIEIRGFLAKFNGPDALPGPTSRNIACQHPLRLLISDPFPVKYGVRQGCFILILFALLGYIHMSSLIDISNAKRSFHRSI